jgi:hypothetical protein
MVSDVIYARKLRKDHSERVPTIVEPEGSFEYWEEVYASMVESMIKRREGNKKPVLICYTCEQVN